MDNGVADQMSSYSGMYLKVHGYLLVFGCRVCEFKEPTIMSAM